MKNWLAILVLAAAALLGFAYWHNHNQATQEPHPTSSASSPGGSQSMLQAGSPSPGSILGDLAQADCPPSIKLLKAEQIHFKKGSRFIAKAGTPLFFLKEYMRDATAGERFEILDYNPVERRVFLRSKDSDGNTIALNALDLHSSSNEAVTVPPNTVVSLRGLVDGKVLVAYNGDRFLVPVNDTDLLSQVTQKRSRNQTSDDSGGSEPVNQTLNSSPSMGQIQEVAFPSQTIPRVSSLPAREVSGKTLEPSAARAAAAAPRDTVPPASISPTLKLESGWDGVMTGGEMTIEDIQEVLQHNSANNDLSFHDIMIYDGVKYLMPLKDALNALGKAHRLEPKTLCSSAAFPQSSFFYYGFDNQPDEYNRLYLVVDSADQAVGVQLVDEAPRGRERGNFHWHCYNFVLQSEKADESLVIKHAVTTKSDCIEIDSFLIDPKVKYGVSDDPGKRDHEDKEGPGAGLCKRKRETNDGEAEGKILEKSKWFLPKPVADLILYRIENAKQN